MKELRSIVKAYTEIDAGKKAAIATVVRVRGSSYRSPGARMLITDDGKWVGSISGGCLEGDALRKARQVMNEQKPLTITYDTREESNQNLGIGLGCNGVIDVLFEPINREAETNAISLYQSFIRMNMAIAVATVFTGPFAGEKLIIDSEGHELSRLSDAILNNKVRTALANLFSSRKCNAVSFEETEVFLELIQPVISVILFGGGFDARPVSTLAKSLGWNVSVTDECVAHIAPVFFPEADQLALCQREFVDRDFKIDPYTACVLMSHNYEYDRDVLKKVLASQAPYIGILGPRKRFDKMLNEFAQDGLVLSAEDLQRIHSPIGLDIGAETPDEIAVSIISEIQSKFSNRSGGFLKYRSGPIHQRDHLTDQVFKQVYLNEQAEVKKAKS